MKELELLKTFPKTSREAWKEKAIQDLKGADFDRKLVWKTYDGIPVQPFYTAEDTANNILLDGQHGLLGNSGRTWVNYVEIEVNTESEANAFATKMLEFDATGVLFDLKEKEQVDFDSLLKGLPLKAIHISFKSSKPQPGILKDYFSYCSKAGVKLDEIKGFYQSDILEKRIITGEEPDFKTFEQLVKESFWAPHFNGVVVSSHAFADSGANTSQEIGFTLSKTVEYISRLSDSGFAASEIWKNILLHTAIGGDYFFELAKLRALRVLIKAIARSYKVDEPAVQILASSGLWSKSLFDPNVNMLRNTTEAMSAVMGGSDAILIQPHDSSYKTPSDFSHRIALNISNLLKEESYLDKVTDPAGGSYYLETLTSEITTQSLSHFQEVESNGGFIKAFESGMISNAIKAVREQKEKDVATRKQVFVGTNKYPNLQEKITGVVAENDPDDLLLRPGRGTQAFDNLRLRTQQRFEETGIIPKVYLAGFGNLAMRKARATFSSEFFGTAGFNILGEFAFQDALEAASQSASSDADIVVICSSDQEYAAVGEEFVKVFKATASDKLLVVAGYPAEVIDALKAAGVDEFIHVKTNAIEALTAFQNQLFQTQKISES